MTDETFWDQLRRTGAELAHRSGLAGTETVGVVGPLAATLPVIRRLQRSRGGSCDVVVLSTRAEIMCEPGWTLARNGARLAEAAHRPGPVVLVIDVPVPLPLWVGPLVERLRRAGMGLVHHAVEGDPDPDDLAAATAVLGQPLEFDLISPVDPGRLVALIDVDAPVSSVRGEPLSPELVVAARRAGAGLGRGR